MNKTLYIKTIILTFSRIFKGLMSNIHFFDANAGSGNLGDLEKTLVINNLLTIPLEKRNNDWVAEFIDNIAEANLAVSEPEIIMSTEGFPYFNLRSVEPGENFQAYVIKNKLGNLLQNGFGVALNTRKENPDWMFSYGDLLNYALRNEFYTDEHHFSINNQDFVIGSDEELLVGQPAQEILPDYARRQIREFLQYSGVKNPMVMLIARNYTDEEKVTQDLVFNITPKNFSNEKEYKQAMNTISWFLPKHYSLVGLETESVDSGFQPL